MSQQPPVSNQSTKTRRRALGAALGALAAAAALPSLANALESSPEASPASGTWSFTDDKGITVTLPERPVRILADVNAAAPLWDFGIRPVAVFGWNASETGDFGPAGGNVDPSTVDVAGNVTEPFQLEKALASQPDLIVTLTWTIDDPTEYWSIDTEILPQAQSIAPIVAVSGTGRADENTTRFAELAGLLGADLDSPELRGAKARYDGVLGGFPEIAESKSDLSILFISVGTGDAIYVANPPDWADLTLYSELGLNLVRPETAVGTYWESLSMEEAIKYPADILFNSTRPGTLTPDELKAHPTFSRHPAVQAGQIGAWNQDFIMSYQGMAIALETTIAAIQTSAKVT